MPEWSVESTIRARLRSEAGPPFCVPLMPLPSCAFGDAETFTSARDNHGALTICLHAGGKPDSVSAGSGLGGIKGGSGCSVDSLNQKSSS